MKLFESGAHCSSLRFYYAHVVPDPCRVWCNKTEAWVECCDSYEWQCLIFEVLWSNSLATNNSKSTLLHLSGVGWGVKCTMKGGYMRWNACILYSATLTNKGEDQLKQHALFKPKLQSTLKQKMWLSNMYCELLDTCHFCITNLWFKHSFIHSTGMCSSIFFHSLYMSKPL